jgi:8-oxo-dGTP diphosphatase
MPMSDYVRALREKIGTDLMMSFGVSALIRDDQGRVLLQKRADNGRWGTPGGALDPGETPADAIVREVWEETGLIVEPQRLIAILGGPALHITYPNGDDVSVVAGVFDCAVTGGDLRPDGVESLALAYFDPVDALTLDLPGRIRQYVDHMLRADGPAFFESSTWTPPADGVRSHGMSPLVRDLRAKVGHDLLLMPACAAAIFNAEGHILLQKRGDNGTWGLIGGAADPDEQPADTVVREAWEETGLRVEPVQIVGVYSGPDFMLTYPNQDRAAVVSTLFECRIVDGEAIPDGHESVALRFMPPEEALALPDLYPNMHERIRRAVLARGQADPWRAYFAPPVWQPPDRS